MAWFRANVDITAGGVVTINSGDPIALIRVGDELVSGSVGYEISIVTSSDFKILDWSNGATTTDIKVKYTAAAFQDGVNALNAVSVFGNGVVSQFSALTTELGTVDITDAAGVVHTTPTLRQLGKNAGTSYGSDVTTSSTDSTPGSLLKVGDFGISDAVALGANDDLDDIIKSGFYYQVTGGNATAANNYPVTSAGSLLVISRGINTSIQSQTYTRFGNDEADTSWTRTWGGTWSRWRLNSDSGNTNFNVFEYITGQVADNKAVARTVNIVDSDMSIHSFDDPTGLTNSGAGYTVTDVISGSDLATGVFPSLPPPSSRRNAIFRFAVTGATEGKLCRITATGPTSTTVNF